MGKIEDLRMFALIVEHKSISRAAEKLNIAKSAVSRRLGLLEDHYGARLVDRAPGVWAVTPVGRELYQRAVRVVGDMDEIESDFVDLPSNIAGPLSVSVPRDFGLSFLAESLVGFTARHPEIQLTVDFDDRSVDLARENYDFAIRISPDIEAGLVALRIGSTTHHLCASPGYLASFGHPAKLADLADHKLLHFGPARRSNWHFLDESGNPHEIGFHPAMNSNSGSFLLGAAKNGLGIARLPDFLVAGALRSGAVLPVLPQMSVAEWGVFLVHAEDRRLNRRMRLFADDMKRTCAEFLV